MKTKKCSKCGEVKNASLFIMHKLRCKECNNLSQKDYRDANKGLISARRKAYYRANKEYFSSRERFHCENLTDHYIASVFKFPRKDIPKLLIEAKRVQIKILRECQ